jgi:hypothetical protein
MQHKTVRLKRVFSKHNFCLVNIQANIVSADLSRRSAAV